VKENTLPSEPANAGLNPFMLNRSIKRFSFTWAIKKSEKQNNSRHKILMFFIMT
jgi:hypothetical protein